MATATIDPRRVQTLNDLEPRGDRRYVLYWMQHTQRAERNEALEFAVARANDFGVPLLVAFGLTEDYPDGSLRHFRFMLEGLVETARAIRRRKFAFVLRSGSPPDVARDLAGDAVEVVTDRGYLRHHRRWRADVAGSIGVRMTQVECDLIVPVETASDDREYAARTIRRQINEAADDFLVERRTRPVDRDWSGIDVPSGEPFDDDADVDDLLGRMNIDRAVDAVDWIRGGTSAAKSRLKAFVDDDLTGYDDARGDVNEPKVSLMSPYLHLGMISPVEVATAVRDARSRRTDDTDSYLEELLVRRELTHNFVHYTPDDYDRFNCLPNWAAETLEDHKDDERPHIYTAEQLEDAETDDDVWNAAMTEMKHRGYLHNQLRMYWGKRVIAWTNTPRYAFETLLHLNNKYFLDGRDANSYANVAWCFGLHDRAFGERDVYGKVRYLSRGGLDRKFDTAAYVRSIDGRYR